MSADPLSDALAVADARCVFSGGFTAGGDWSVRLRGRDKLKINAVVRGSCLLVTEDDGEVLRIEAGDVVVTDGRRSYVLCSDPGLEPVRAADVTVDPGSRMAQLGDGDDFVAVSGHIDLSRDSGDLLRSALPPLLRLRASAAEAPVLSWLVGQLLAEMTAHRAGADFAADQLAQLVLVQVLRVCLDGTPGLPHGLAARAGRRRPRPGPASPARRSGTPVAAGGTRPGGGDVPDHVRRPLQGGRRGTAPDLPAELADDSRRTRPAGGRHPRRDARAAGRLHLRERVQQRLQTHHRRRPRRYRDAARAGAAGADTVVPAPTR